MTKSIRSLVAVFLFLLALAALPLAVQAQGSAFTYQGRLMESNAPANGTFEFEFSLYDRLAGGSNLGTLTLEETPVTNGLFTVVLDFGMGAFNGAERWLEIYARNDGAGGPGVLLTPRQRIYATPYAIMAGRADTATTATNLAGVVSSNQIADGAVVSAKIQPGSIVNAHISPVAAIADTKLGTIATAGKVANSATTATSANSSNTIVLRNGAGSFTANQIVATGGFNGNGSDLTGLDADSIQYGTLDDARLSANVTRLGSTIDPSELTKPYQSGTIPSAKPETAFWRLTYPVTFPQPFAATPNVTVALNSLDLAALDALKVNVAAKSPTGFTAAAILPVPVPEVLDYGSDFNGGISAISVNGQPGVFFTRDQLGSYTNELWFKTLVGGTNWQESRIIRDTLLENQGISGAMIQGRPAVVFTEYTSRAVRYVRALNATGTAWGAPVTLLATNDFYNPSAVLLEVGGRPSVAYNDFDGNLRFVRANDSTGGSWGSGVVVSTNGYWANSLAIINGNPAIAHLYVESFSKQGLAYHRANDANGTTWGPPSLLLTNTGFNGGGYTNHYSPQLTTVNGHPAIAFQRGANFIETRSWYVRASDANGASWGTPHQLVSGYTLPGRQSLIVTDGRPAVCLADDGSPRFIHAADANGDAWGPLIDLDPALSSSDDYVEQYNHLDMVMINGMPWVFYNVDQSPYYRLKYTRATVPQFQIDWTAIAP